MTKEEYSKLILELYKNNNNSITKKDIINAKGINEKCVYKYFNTFQDMCKELNLYTPSSQRLSKEEIKDILLDIYNEYGIVTNNILKKTGRISGDTIKRKFGSISNAYIECNIPLQAGQRKNVGRDEIIIELERLKNEYGYISKPLMEKFSEYSPKIVQRIFGTFTSMYKELGYEGHKSGRVPTDEELIAECKRIYDEHNFLSYDLLEKFSTISTTCFKDRAKKMKWNGINYYREQVGCELPTLDWGESPSARFAIEKFSNALNEQPIKEKRFSWLVNTENNAQLRIDAYYPNANIAIEYNGPQHYLVDGIYTKTEEELIKRQALDKLKADLIRRHGIKLIVIHFKDKVTNEYIQEAISNNN